MDYHKFNKVKNQGQSSKKQQEWRLYQQQEYRDHLRLLEVAIRRLT